jgi:hypothetical protein
MQEEIWKPIKNYERLYMISNNGRIYSLAKNIIKKTFINKQTGYPTTSLYKDKMKKTFNIHRLVAQAFIPNPENKQQVNHINEVRNDNRVENLEWVTPRENAIHNNGHIRRGIKIKKKVIQLNMDGVFIKTWDSATDASKKLGVDFQGISQVCLGKRNSAYGFLWRFV